MDRLSAQPPRRLTPNLFGIAFGICGLAECWAAAHDLVGAPSWPASTLWVLAGAVWLATLVAYVTNVVTTGRVRTDLSDPTYAPFLSLIFIAAMMLGVALAGYLPGIGETVFVVALVLTVAFGGWLTAQWIVLDIQLSQWHPGYFLPTVAGGLIAAAGSAALGYDTLAGVMFGYGMTCWLVLGSILLLRLFTQPALPTALLPTIAIELAPPVVAANAWFEITGDRLDALAMGLAGYGVLMVMVQLRLAPIYRRVPFGPGWWSFSFSYAAAFVVAIRWLAVEQVAQQQALTYALLAIVTTGMAALAARTVRHLARGTFVPRPPASGLGAPAMARSAAVKGRS
jgi:tellurite resistance protein